MVSICPALTWLPPGCSGFRSQCPTGTLVPITQPPCCTLPSPLSISVCLGNSNVLFALICFRGLEEYCHPSVFMGDWFWGHLGYPNPRVFCLKLHELHITCVFVLQVDSGFLVHTHTTWQCLIELYYLVTVIVRDICACLV